MLRFRIIARIHLLFLNDTKEDDQSSATVAHLRPSLLIPKNGMVIRCIKKFVSKDAMVRIDYVCVICAKLSGIFVQNGNCVCPAIFV